MFLNVQKYVNELLSKENSGHNMDHINRVVNLSQKFAKKENAQIDIVTLIALLHDVDDYKIFGSTNAKNLTNAKKIMNECNIAKNIQDKVCLELNSIGFNKRLKGITPKTVEGQVVSDADMCDAIGAGGILRVFMYHQKHNSPFFDKNIFPTKNITAGNYKTCASSGVCHIFEKILKLKNYMLTKSGKEEAEFRTRIVVDFLYHYFTEENALEWLDYLNKECDQNVK